MSNQHSKDDGKLDYLLTMLIGATTLYTTGMNKSEGVLIKGHLNDIKTYFNNIISQTEKAYGACHNCYGKGYSTTADGIIGYSDFGGEGFKTPITTKMKFCKCERGEQLNALLSPSNSKEES